jgi:hypothetical protein
LRELENEFIITNLTQTKLTNTPIIEFTKMWNFLKSPGLNSFLTFVSTAFGFTSLTTGWGAVFTIACFSLAILLMIRVIQEYFQRRNPTQPPPEPPKTDWPAYLFYLPNRKKQTAKLSHAINEHEQTISKQRPLVCLVPGEYQESHEKFKDCFVNKTLPKLYHWISHENDVKCIELTMCDCSPDRDELQDDILNKLIEKLPHYPVENTKAGVTQSLAEQGKPVILYIDILIEDCQPVNDIIEKGFIEFWRDWPAFQSDLFINQQDKQFYRLLVFMCFRYPDTTQRRFQLTNPWRKSSRIRKKVTKQLNRLDKPLYWFQVASVVLPQLEPIKKEAAIEWLWGDCKKHIKPGYDTLKEMEAKIRQFYEGHAYGIPMETLAPQLQKILQETIT